MLPLLADHPDCAFLLFCAPEELEDELLTALSPIRSIMLVVDMTPGAAQAFRRRIAPPLPGKPCMTMW